MPSEDKKSNVVELFGTPKDISDAEIRTLWNFLGSGAMHRACRLNEVEDVRKDSEHYDPEK